ncbi:MAG: HAMP domain-containing sensor histidine kinase [Bacteroidota bacterium]|nr:HAMP domain-containing sensor histidine kinase [Bacteroidota bacterium]MDP4197371.1 HAMP domain-containing sensor histidine kinase [Bacteroidota bacterium]
MYTQVSESSIAEKGNDFQEQVSLISRTANALAHELKTPLTSIKLNVEMLSEDVNLSENKKKSLAIVRKEIERLSGIVDSYLILSRQNILEYSTVSLYEFIEEIKLLVYPELNKRNIVLKNVVSPVKLKVDRDKIKSVFLNLISNSIDAIGQNGTIEIYSEFDPNHKIFSVFVKDNGCGIKDCDSVFKPFYTTKATGNGLGLVLASEVMKKHNGTLHLCSSKSGETVFEISFSL